ncbi:hypothetical protein MIND_00535500 [Mycena indigotica]|uniref:Integrase catalytic domain-containing protein n=1 Tax=Mycena indigotica TaxID=2126181 RepID=A0A8H6W8X3_9AGAR|nr:uncharacterized protein MIND_00535500 [Mycena indigotica]KAF7307411.1 hypothetical protein MIND_00535500 [Mycena indigotica]
MSSDVDEDHDAPGPSKFKGNQHRRGTLLDQHPELPSLIQKCINEHVRQGDIPELLSKEHGINIGLRSIERIIKMRNLSTTRHSHLTDVEKVTAILSVTEDDPLGRWGGRKVKEKLALDGVHISLPQINDIQRTVNAEAVSKRHPGTRKVHKSGLFSSGPNEEWCIDGHEKIFEAMGIGIYGIIDKYSRKELLLLAMRSIRRANIPPAVYLQLVLELGGIPVQTTTDMGTETGVLAALQTSLRCGTQLSNATEFAQLEIDSQESFPELSLELVPAHRSVKSVYNITRERNWRPLWEKDLANIRFQYETGKIDAGYHPTDPIHQQVLFLPFSIGFDSVFREVAVFVWGMAVQRRLDEHKHESALHQIRKQRKSLLPTGGRPRDFYNHPERWGGTNQLIAVDSSIIDKLITENTPSDLRQFTSSAVMEALCQMAYKAVGSPEVSSRNAWNTFTAMVNEISVVNSM